MMRKTLELKLVELRFEHYTLSVRQCIAKSTSTHGCSFACDIVLNQLWRDCRYDTIGMIDEEYIYNDMRKFRDPAHTLPETADERVRSYITDAVAYEDELAELGDDDFERVYRGTITPIVEITRKRREAASRERDRWDFFNEVEAEADFEQWRGKLITPAQAIALSFGKDPEVVKPQNLMPYRRVGRSPFREAFENRLVILDAAVVSGRIASRFSIDDFVSWAVVQKWELPKALLSESIDENVAFWKAKCEATEAQLRNIREGLEELDPLSRGSLYKMLLGMAISRFGYRIDQRSGATKAIRDACDEDGLRIKEDAIRGHLGQAVQHLDFQRTKPILWSRNRKTET